MSGLKQIKGKIAAMQKSQTVTKAMEAVSAAKMRRAQGRALGGRAYARAAASVLARVSGSQALQSHPLTREHESSLPLLYIVITSDKGLAGALNSGVLRAVERDMEGTEAQVVAIGKKAEEYFKRRDKLAQSHPNNDTLTAEMVKNILQFAEAEFVGGRVRAVKIAYQNFVSTFEQRPTIRTVYPLSLEELQNVVGDIVPARGAFAGAGVVEAPAVYTLEPSASEVLAVLLPKLASVIVYHALLESQASEHSARMVAMKGATDKAGEMQDSLTLQFNKARQAAITREVSEIIGGMEALRN